MITRDLYYFLKPAIPRWLQIEVRRRWILLKKAGYEKVWPIDESAGNPPENWPGWPEGKKFALILTHDVETAKGLPRVKKMMELEQRLGFKSAFQVCRGRLSEASRAIQRNYGFRLRDRAARPDAQRQPFPFTARVREKRRPDQPGPEGMGRRRVPGAQHLPQPGMDSPARHRL